MFSIFTRKSGEILVGTKGYGIHVSTDGASTWHREGTDDSSVFSFDLDPSGQIYAAAQGGIYRSDGVGTKWDKVWSPNADVYSILVASNGFIFAANDSDGVVRSTDSGASWPPLMFQYYGLYPSAYSLLKLPNGDILTGVGDWDQGKGIMRIPSGTDTLVQTSLDSGIIRALAVNEDGVVYAGSETKGIYSSHNNGATWQSVSSPDSTVSCLTIDTSGFIYVGTPSGLFRSERTTLGIDEQKTALPTHLALAQNYPNPFNPTTAIRYHLSAISDVTLKIYDVLGREVATLVDGKQSPGLHTVKWDASRYASGVYFYRLVSIHGSHRSVETKAMVLIK